MTPASISFVPVEVGSYADSTFTVENIGGGILVGEASVPAPFSIQSGESYSLTIGQTQTVTVRFSPTAAQPYSEIVTFIGGSGATRPVTGIGSYPPEISVTMMAMAGSEGANLDLEFGISNEATDLFDSGIDALHPLPGPGQTFEAYFLTTDPVFPQLNGDYRAPIVEITDIRVWTLEIESDNEEIILTWDASGVPGNLVSFMDTGTQNIDMKLKSSLGLPAGQHSLVISMYSRTRPTDIDINLKAGWNMVSVPVTPPDNSTSAVFPGALAVYTWNPISKSYIVPTIIEPDTGYWVAVTESTIITVTGTLVDTWTTNIKAGWNMIGSIYTSTSVVVPNDDPDGSIIPPAYWWDPVGKSYTLSYNVDPGKGYWVASVQDCTLTMP